MVSAQCLWREDEVGGRCIACRGRGWEAVASTCVYSREGLLHVGLWCKRGGVVSERRM